MSTSDAAGSELGVGGGRGGGGEGETPPPLHGTATRTATARERQESEPLCHPHGRCVDFGKKLLKILEQQNETFGDAPTGQQCHPSAIRRRETDNAQILRADKPRREEASCCGDPKVQSQKPIGSSFTSFLFFRLSGNQGLEKPERRLKKNLDSCPHSLTETQWDESVNSRCQVNGQASPPDTSVEVASNPASSERISAETKEDVIPAVCHNFSNGQFEEHACNDLCRHPCASNSRTGSKSVDLGDIEDQAKLERQTDSVELSNPIRTMLSSSVVTVLAPHWNGPLRRTKRFDTTSNLDARGHIPGVVNTAAYHTHPLFQEGGNRSLTDGSQANLRFTRKNTLDWSTKSGPAWLDYESKRKMIQTVSLDVNSGETDKREKVAGSSSLVGRNVSSVSVHSLDLNEQRRNLQTGHEGLSSLSSKPTSSSLLLSLRRVNPNGWIPHAASTVTEVNPSPLNSSTHRDGQSLTARLSQNIHNNNPEDMSKPLLSPSALSYGTTETGPILSPSSSNHREGTLFERRRFSASLTNTDTEAVPFNQQPHTTNTAHPSHSSATQAFLTMEPSERQVNCRGSNKSTNLLSESSVSSTRHSSYDHSPLLKTQSLPRPTLTSSSWWKQVTQNGSSSLKLNDKASITDMPDTPHNDKSDLSSPSRTNNKRFGGQMLDNRDNNNTIESVCKGNMNLVKKTQEGTHSFKQRNAEDSPDDASNRLVKQKYDSNLNIREPQKPHSLPGVSSSSKNGRVAAQTIVCRPHDLTKHTLSNSSFPENVTKLQPTLLNPTNSNTPTETCSKYIDNHYTSNTNSIRPLLHKKETQILTKPSPVVSTSTLNSQAKRGSDPVSTQTNIHASSYMGSPYQTQKFTTTTNTTPLGFQRSYTSIPKPLRPKTVCSLIPTVSALSKSNYSPVPTASTVSSCTTASTGSQAAATTAPSPSLLTPPVTPATSALTSSPTTVNSSPFTPPDTPLITSPNYSDTSNPKGGRTFSNSQDSDTKEGKRARRVTWQDMNVPCSEPMTAEMPEPMSSPSSSRSPQSIKAPSIFSLLRSNSPPKNTYHVCSRSPKTSSIQAVKGERYRSLSSDSADLAARERERSQERLSNTMISEQGRRDLTTPRQERAPSVESDTVHCNSSAPLPLPPDFSSGYELRYCSPPYSTLMSTRSAQGETKTTAPRSPRFQQPTQSVNTPHVSTHNDPNEGMTSQMPRLPWSTISLPQPLSLPFKTRTSPREGSKCGVSETDKLNNNHGKDKSQDCQNGQILLVNNRVHVHSQSLQGDKVDTSPSAFVTETLVYSIKSKVGTATDVPKNATPKQHSGSSPASLETNLSQPSHIVKSKETIRPSDQGFSGSSSSESQTSDDVRSNRRMKETVVGNSRFFSTESNNEQSPKKGRFALKKSVSTPNSSLSRSESDRANKTNNKMDQVLHRLRQTFSTRRSEEDSSFPWKWKRGSQTPSVSGSSDLSIVSDVPVEGSKSPEKQEQEERVVLKDKDKETEVADALTQNRHILTTTSAPGKPMAGDKFSIVSQKFTPDTDQDEQNSCPEPMSQKQFPSTQSPTTHQFEFYRDNGTDYKPTNQYPSCRDPSPGRSPDPSAVHPSQFRKSTSSPRSPFSSPSPPSPFPPPDVTDDNVFYSPKPQCRRDSSSPCEPGEGISLGGSRRSRVSTGPPSPSPGQDKQCFATSYADLKYGIEPGKSFSVSSVLSSRPSGPGRISTGSRFMSVGDLYESALTCGGSGKDLDPWSVSPDWTTGYDGQPSKDCCTSYFPGYTGKMRSRSLPRSLTRRLGNWTSGVSGSPPDGNKTSKPAHLWSPGHFTWDTASPPTPPPTPPTSPVSRRMSTSSGHSSPTFPSSSGAPQQAENQTSRGRLPSRGYISSLSTFEEFSDCSSDTTTDDEYYLAMGEDEEKETEL